MSDVKHLPKFKSQQVTRQIDRLGSLYVFSRYQRNKYGEETDEIIRVIAVHGIFHTQKTKVSRVTGDATSSVYKDTPMLLMRYDKFIEDPLIHKDVVTINGTKYEVLDYTNVADMNFAIDISLGELR